MPEVQLFPNTQPLSLTIELNGYGRRLQTYAPREVWYDNEGLVRLFTVKYDDGTVGNFKLLPKHENALKIAEFMTTMLASIGLAKVAGKLLKSHPFTKAQPESVHDIGQFLAGSSGASFVHDFFQRYSVSDSAYYEVFSHELVITSPIKLSLGKGS